MLAAFIFRTVRSCTMRHGYGYYFSSVTPMAVLQSEITNLGLNLASAHVNIARLVLADGGSILQDYGTSFSGLQGSLRIHQ
jgi:hypothetical protein